MDSDGCEQGYQGGYCQEPQHRQHYPAEITEHEAASRGEDAATGTGQKPPGRLMGDTQLPAEFSGRPQPPQGLADGPLRLEPFRLQRSDRVPQVIGEFRSNLGHIGSRQPQFRRHPIEISRYLRGASLPGRDR